MQAVAQAALVLKLTGSGTQLGLVTAAQFLPVFVFGPYEGVLASRLDTRRVIRITQLLFLVDSLVLGVLTIAGTIPVWLVYALALLAGLITSVDTPARQAVVFEVVGPEVLANAVTLNFIVMNVARIVGPWRPSSPSR
jgi:MFS family permease